MCFIVKIEVESDSLSLPSYSATTSFMVYSVTCVIVSFTLF